MKSLIWPSKNKKSGTGSSTSSSSPSIPKGSSSGRSLSPSDSSLFLGKHYYTTGSGSSGSHNTTYQSASGSTVGGNGDNGHIHGNRRKSSANFSLRRHSNAPNLSNGTVYLSESNSKSAKSVGSSNNKEDSSSVLSEGSGSQEITPDADTNVNYRVDDVRLNVEQNYTSMRESMQSASLTPVIDFHDGNNASQDQGTDKANNSSGSIIAPENFVNLNKDNYDSLIFKAGWLNKSHGSTVITSQSSSSASTHTLQSDAFSNKSHISSASSGHRESRFYASDFHQGNNSNHDISEPQITVPDYRLYRAQLKGSVLSLYKSGLHSNVKYFDPILIGIKETSESSHPYSSSNSSNTPRQPNSTKAIPNIKYLSEIYPHPDLRLGEEEKIVSGTLESLCHSILFSYPNLAIDDAKFQRNILNLLLILPLLDDFVHFLFIFNQFGLTFTKHTSKVTNSSTQFYNVSRQVDDLMTERLGLVVKTVLDMFPSFLLDDQMIQAIIKLLDTISLHNDEISNNLKISVADKHNELNKLTAFSRSSNTKYTNNNNSNYDTNKLLEDIINVESFLKMDINKLADEVHEINLKFNQTWSPRSDYSLLYDSKYINNNIVALNPLVFNNNYNVHFLGRLLVCHLFSNKRKSLMNAKLRAKVLTKWVEFGGRFEYLGDMVSWLAVATIICSLPILRLSSSWQYVPEHTLRIIFKDWIPTIAQLDRRQMSSKSTSSVFILAPPNLDDPFIRSNVISYFGDLIIHADDLPLDTKFKYLEKKINRTKNAFYKWQQRLEKISTKPLNKKSSTRNVEPASSSIYQFWKYHLAQPILNIDGLMKLSVKFEPPRIDQKLYSNIGSQRSSLLSGSYLPILFNELFPNYSLFSKDSLVAAAGVITTAKNDVAQTKSSLRRSKAFSISEPLTTTKNEMLSEDIAGTQITGLMDIDAPLVKEMSLKQSNRQHMLKCIRDAFNIDSDIFHVSDDIIFKSMNDFEIKSPPASIVIETPKRFSQHSNTTLSGMRDSQENSNRLSKTLENMDFFSNIGKVSETLKESVISVVLKSGSLDKIYDLLVLTAGVFSKLIDTKDLEKYYYHERKRNRGNARNSRILSSEDAIGILDYAFVKLTMDIDIFTETFFNSYKSFTTTVSVLENLAKRYVGAKSCALSISQLLHTNGGTKLKTVDSSLNEQKFPVWDGKVSHDDNINTNYWVKIQVGAAEAIFNLVKNHYADFTDDMATNTTLLDILKIMEQDIGIEWPSRIDELRKVASFEEISETESLVSTLTELFNATRSTYQKQLYRPLGVNRTCRKVTALLESFKSVSLMDYSGSMNYSALEDPLLSQFHNLRYNDYESILKWVYCVDKFVAEKFYLVTKQEWFACYQVLELYSNESLTSLFSFSLHSTSNSMITAGTSQLDELEISDFFTWISTLISRTDQGDVSCLSKLPESVQLLVKLHISLTSFFVVEISDIAKSSEHRVETCTLILQVLNYVRWKNSSLDLFQSEVDDDPSAISPHIPSFIETAICNSIIRPESRYYEHSWRTSHRILSNSKDPNVLTSISNILEDIDDKHIRSFLEIDGPCLSKPKSLCPCPGWIISRLLEISQFVPNMSIINSKLINFDKRRFVNNIISNALDLVPTMEEYTSDEGPTDKLVFGSSLFCNFTDSAGSYRKNTKTIAATEIKVLKYQEKGLFNEILVKEVDKTKRDHKKIEGLIVQERDNKRSTILQQVIQRKNRSSVIIPSVQSNLQSARSLPKSPSSVSATSINTSPRSKRTSMASLNTRNSVISSSGHNHMSKKLGGFFRRPFSIGGFNSSASSNSLSSILIPDVQNNGSVSPSNLPLLETYGIQDQKPVISLKTFEIKSILEIMNHKKNSGYIFSFKLVMFDGHEHILQSTSALDLQEWVKMIKASKRYSFHSKRFKGKTHNKIFGVPLEDICEREGTVIPTIITKLLEEIELRGLDEVGLYRIPGSVGSVNALKNAFDEEGAISNSFTLEDDRWFEINAIAGCFKMYLRELPDCLFSNERVCEFADLALQLKSSAISSDEYKVKISDLLQSLPICYYQTMKRIVYHLNKVHAHVDNNRMDASNLAIVFSMSFIDQDDLASSMGSILGAVQNILQQFIRAPDDYFI